MLAKPTKAINEVLDRFEGKEFTCEYKYDGERAQVHMLEGGEIAVFSRNSENMSEKYPDLVQQVPRVSCVLLAEFRAYSVSSVSKRGQKALSSTQRRSHLIWIPRSCCHSKTFLVGNVKTSERKTLRSGSICLPLTCCISTER